MARLEEFHTYTIKESVHVIINLRAHLLFYQLWLGFYIQLVGQKHPYNFKCQYILPKSGSAFSLIVSMPNKMHAPFDRCI
jgi:hypothetical protein